MLAGSVASMAILGAPDKVLITLTELASLAARIARATSAPLVVDADHGYGNALNVERTIVELEAAGVAGVTVEDTMLPSAFGTTGKAGLVPLDEAVGKMRAALSARSDPDLVIFGRTSGLAIVGKDETLERIRAYERAGVDAIFVAGVENEDDLAAVAAAIDVPLMLGRVAHGLLADRDLLVRHRVRLCLQGHAPYAAAVRAVHDTLAAMRDGTPPGRLPGIAGRGLMDTITAADHYASSEQRFLGVDDIGEAIGQ